MLHPDEVLTPERLLEHVWDDRADPFTNTVRVTVSNLRRKLAGAAAASRSTQSSEVSAHRGHRVTRSPFGASPRPFDPSASGSRCW